MAMTILSYSTKELGRKDVVGGLRATFVLVPVDIQSPA